MKYQIGNGFFDTDSGVLWVDDQEQRLRLKVLQLLICLLNKKQQIVTRDELIDSIWQGNHAVGDKALNSVIYALRKAFKPIAPDTTVIETLPKRGYRFTLEANEVQPQAAKSVIELALSKMTDKVVYVFAGSLLISSLLFLPTSIVF